MQMAASLRRQSTRERLTLRFKLNDSDENHESNAVWCHERCTRQWCTMMVK
jgi:hypothetical protein